MKITELIVQLDEVFKLHGDLDVCLLSTVDSWFAFDFSASLEVMEIETFEGSKELEMISAMVPSDICFDEDPTPHLKIVK